MNTRNEILITPRIYVASLSDYNAGHLHGVWIDADRGTDHIWKEISAMLKSSTEPNPEEWAIHDFEGFGAVRLGEAESVDAVAEIAELIEKYGYVFSELVSHFGGLPSGMDEAERCMEDAYFGSYERIEQYVEDFIDECYGDMLSKLPDIIKYHIDYEGIARDFEMGGDIFTIEVNGQVHVFSGNV